MSLFVCEGCAAVENTACTSGYHLKERRLCSECANGKWHSAFPKRQASEAEIASMKAGRILPNPDEAGYVDPRGVKQGPNVKKLIARKMALIAIPPGGGILSGLRVLTTAATLTGVAEEATRWVETVIAAVKAAPNSEAWQDDEAIAGEILRRVEEKDATAARAHA